MVTASDTGNPPRPLHLALLMPPLAALLYPFLLAAFHANICTGDQW
jgi:hypothetical protein